ncbi:hypothetical protein [Bosea lathyri]|uniref:hypothetical protein n=1 Tax=Bosea lathyri TaxID=1036778 RepID=UPI0011B057E9|nr:hypothetical protein [Bosea lathyri]
MPPLNLCVETARGCFQTDAGLPSVGDNDLAPQPEAEQHDPRMDVRQDAAALADLVLDLGIADDGACDELRKQRVIHPEIDHALCRAHIAAINVDDVGDALEREERNAGRQQDVFDRDTYPTQEADQRGRHALHEKDPIFIIDQRRKIQRDADAEERLTPHFDGRIRDVDRDHLVHDTATRIQQSAPASTQ